MNTKSVFFAGGVALLVMLVGIKLTLTNKVTAPLKTSTPMMEQHSSIIPSCEPLICGQPIYNSNGIIIAHVGDGSITDVRLRTGHN